jgi:hypothetical protein
MTLQPWLRRTFARAGHFCRERMGSRIRRHLVDALIAAAFTVPLVPTFSPRTVALFDSDRQVEELRKFLRKLALFGSG